MNYFTLLSAVVLQVVASGAIYFSYLRFEILIWRLVLCVLFLMMGSALFKLYFQMHIIRYLRVYVIIEIAIKLTFFKCTYCSTN